MSDSDFDDVLERLLGEPQFRTALATDPAAALSGYHLSADELELLSAQLTGDAGSLGGVENRTSKASLAGLLGPLISLIGEGAGAGGHAGLSLAGQHSAGQHPGIHPAGQQQGLTQLPADQGITQTGGADQGITEVTPADQGLTDGVPANQGLTVVDNGGGVPGTGGAPLQHSASADALQSDGVPAPLPGDHAPVGYHPHIDADGDGHWDQYSAVQHADGSVDIYVDRNHDGVVDFVGHDQNHDGRVESADYDEDFNGSYETHMRDTNGDGWLDTRRVDPS